MTSRVVLAVLASLLTLLAGEGALQLATGPRFPSSGTHYRPWMAFDPVFSWRNVPGVPVGRIRRSDGSEFDVRINALGFRGPEIETPKAPGTLRIVCMGDSATFGFVQPDLPSQDDEHVPIVSYVEELRLVLEREGRRNVEVVNAGVVGYSSSHGLRQLLLQVLDLDPDVVTFRFGVNDQYDAWAPALRALEPDGLRRELFYGFYGWKLFRLGLGAYQRIPWLHPEKGSVPFTTNRRFRKNVERFVEVARARGVHLLIMDYPVGTLIRVPQGRVSLREATYVHHKIRKSNRRLQRIAQKVSLRNDIPVLHTAGRKVQGDVPLFNQIDYVHPTPRGAAAIAELLYHELDRLGWLGPAGAAR